MDRKEGDLFRTRRARRRVSKSSRRSWPYICHGFVRNHLHALLRIGFNAFIALRNALHAPRLIRNYRIYPDGRRIDTIDTVARRNRDTLWRGPEMQPYEVTKQPSAQLVAGIEVSASMQPRSFLKDDSPMPSACIRLIFGRYPVASGLPRLNRANVERDSNVEVGE